MYGAHNIHEHKLPFLSATEPIIEFRLQNLSSFMVTTLFNQN